MNFHMYWKPTGIQLNAFYSNQEFLCSYYYYSNAMSLNYAIINSDEGYSIANMRSPGPSRGDAVSKYWSRKTAIEVQHCWIAEPRPLFYGF